MIKILPINSFTDNYIWFASYDTGNFVVDPGDADPVLEFCKTNNIKLENVLITHHHFDHTGGLKKLLEFFPNINIFGPNNIPLINKIIDNKDKISINNLTFKIIKVPGHTLDHIAYFNNDFDRPILFCGDTIFVSGCGRVFEGTFDQMYESLLKLKSLPDNTEIYCAHEYTMSNIEFAMEVEPDNINIQEFYAECSRLRAIELPTVPSTIAQEKITNPFLRCDNKELRKSINADSSESEKEIFANLRQWKDIF